jgi:3-keto-5-aminohexanoate cleavage enzyme
VRVGAQDIPYFSKGKPAKSNVELVSRIARIAKDLGREIATPDDVRKMLKLPGAKAGKKRK